MSAIQPTPHLLDASDAVSSVSAALKELQLLNLTELKAKLLFNKLHNSVWHASSEGNLQLYLIFI